MPRILLLFLSSLLLGSVASPANAQDESHGGIFALSLSGTWAFHGGDVHRGESEEVKDRHWTRVHPDDRDRRGAPTELDVAWYRTRFLWSRRKAEEAFLVLGRIAGRAEVWINGQRIERLMPEAPWNEQRGMPHVYPVDSSALRGPSNLVALRVRRDEGAPTFGVLSGPLQVVAGPEAARLLRMAPGETGGFGAANFAMAGQVSARGQLFSRVEVDPVLRGEAAWPLGWGELAVHEPLRGRELVTQEFEKRHLERSWPLSSFAFEDARLPGLELSGSLYAPIAFRDLWVSALPVVMADLVLTNASGEDRVVELRFRFHKAWDDGTGFSQQMVQDQSRLGYTMGVSPALALAADGNSVIDSPLPNLYRVTTRVSLRPGTSERVRMAIAYRHPNSQGIDQLPAPSTVVEVAYRNWSRLELETQRVDRSLPSSGDRVFDQALRWYASAAARVTRVYSESEIGLLDGSLERVTSAYASSFPHLFLWTDLERQMIERIARGQSPDGRIASVTGDPRAEEPRDATATAWFVLRALRLRDWLGLERLPPSLEDPVRKAVEYLVLEILGDAERPPEVGESLRTRIVRLAAIQSGLTLYPKKRPPSSWRRAWSRLQVQIHTANDEGGWWNGSFFGLPHAAREEGEGEPGRGDVLLHDQALLWAFDLLNRRSQLEACLQVFRAVETPSGVPSRSIGRGTEFVPTGPILPHLNFLDALGRITSGYAREGTELARKIVEADLGWRGEHVPHSALDARTGAALGESPDPRGAAYAALFVQGLLGLSRRGDVVTLRPLIGLEQEISMLSVVLPTGGLTVRREQRGKQWAIRAATRLQGAIVLRYGLKLEPGEAAPLLMPPSTKPDLAPVELEIEHVHEDRFAIVELELQPGQTSEAILLRR